LLLDQIQVLFHGMVRRVRNPLAERAPYLFQGACDCFQDNFFCRPQMVKGRSVAANKVVYLELLRATESEFDLRKIANLFKRDVSLSYRLLRFLNPPLLALHAEIRAIPHALSLRGERAMRKWISLVSIASLNDEAADGLLKLPLLRAM